jgi:hypothetical protein
MNARILAAVRRLALPAVGAALITAAPASAVNFVITYPDAAGYGFNDATVYTRAPFSPDSPGTLGAARRGALEAVVNNWGQRLKGTVPITVQAQFQPLGGTSNSAVLAQAGPRNVFTLSGGGIPDAWFVVSIASQLVGFDPTPATPMIEATFNSDIGSPDIVGGREFYYGLDGTPGPTGIDFYATTLHEFGHGLGVFSLLTLQQSGSVVVPTGHYLPDGGGTEHPAIFDRGMANDSGAGSSLLVNLTPAQRVPILTSNSLYFSGTNARARNNGVNPKLYAPDPVRPGSSWAHADESTYSSSTDTNELMTPASGPAVAHAPGPIATGIMQDMFWQTVPYTMADATLALRAAGGFTDATEANASFLNVVSYNTYPTRLDVADALKIARMAGGAEANPNP